VLELVRALARGGGEGRTVIMVTHDASAAGFGDRVLEIRDGRVV